MHSWNRSCTGCTPRPASVPAARYSMHWTGQNSGHLQHGKQRFTSMNATSRGRFFFSLISSGKGASGMRSSFRRRLMMSIADTRASAPRVARARRASHRGPVVARSTIVGRRASRPPCAPGTDLRESPHDTQPLPVWRRHLGRRGTVPVHVALSLLALPKGPRHPVRHLRRGLGEWLPVERARAGRALGVFARLLPLLLHALLLRRAGRSVAAPRLPALRLLGGGSGCAPASLHLVSP